MLLDSGYGSGDGVTDLSPPMATPSCTPSVLREMMLFSSLDIPPERDTYAMLQNSKYIVNS